MKLQGAARALLGISALAIVGGGQAAPPRSPDGLLDEELAAIAGDAAYPLTSLSVLALRGGRVVYQRHFGRRYIDPDDRARDRPANEATLYRVASVSKLVVALVVMRLVEEGKVSLDSDVGDYLGYRLRNPHFPDVPLTLRMLLTHTSSLRDEGGYSWDESVRLRDVLTAGGATWSSTARPGAWFTYCNLAWGVIGTLVENVTGERFHQAARRLVLDPLGMSGDFDPAAMASDRVRDIATLYRKRAAGDDDQPWNPAGPWIAQVDDYALAGPVSRASAGYVPGTNATLFGPQGGLRASALDMSRVLRLIAGGGELDGKRLLRRETMQAMLAMQWRHDGRNGQSDYGTARGRFQAWGLGLQRFMDVSGPAFGDRLVAAGGFTAVGHLGDAYGLTSVVAVDPASGDGLVMLIGGSGFDPAKHPGAYSSLARHEERILTALHRRAVLGKAD